MQTQQSWGRVKLTEVNPHLVCVLCHGYFIDATTMAECPHSFCRSCILLYLETKSYCPICEVQIHKTKPHLNLKPDKTLQDIVYKLVPGLYHSEMKRRRHFYQTKYPNRDLDLGPEARGVGVERIIYSPEDLISLSLEYYDEKDEFDSTDQIAQCEDITITYEREKEEWARTRPESFAAATSTPANPPPQAVEGEDGLKKRYLQCPAVLNMRLLKKFIRIKYGLSPACTVEILYRRESLPDSYSLMDVAYIYTWKRNNPMRFYYRIHVPTTLRKILPPLKASSEPIKDTTPNKKLLKSPELLDAVGLRPKIWFDDTEDSDIRPPLPKIPKLELDSKPIPKIEAKSEVKDKTKNEAKSTAAIEEKERLQMSAEETAKSLLLLRNGHTRKEPEQANCEGKSQSGPETTAASRPPTSNGGVFKVPQNMTKRFFINGGKLVAVNPKTTKNNKSGDKNKVNGEVPLPLDRFTNPLGLPGGHFDIQGGKLPPGSPRPPPNSEKYMKTKYMSPSGFLLNRVTPDVTFSQNKTEPGITTKKAPNSNQSLLKPSQPKPIQTLLKPDGTKKTTKLTNGQPVHRKEPNRLEQIVQNCLKKETTQKSVGEAKSGKEAEVQNDNSCVKRSGALNAGSGESDARAAQSIRPTDHPSRVDTKEESEKSILKRKLNDPPFNRRPMPLSTPNKDNLGDAKNRRLVTPDVSIELTANPAKDNQSKEKKKEPTDLTTLTNRFLHDIQRMNKKPESEIKINKSEQMCASIVNIEKVPAPSSHLVSSPKSSPGGTDKLKISDGSDFSSEDQLFIDIRNKCEALKRKNPEPASVAIERVSKDEIVNTSSKTPPLKGDGPTSTVSETPAKPSGTHKKLPRLIEINAPPRPKLPALLQADPKQKTGLKMTTVRKEVPIRKEGPQVRRDNNGALDLSSGLSPPNPKSDKTSNRLGIPSEKSATSPALSPLLNMPSFPMPEANRSPPIRIPSVKPKTSPNPRPSSLSSSSPSPPADSRSAVDSFTSAAYQQLMRQQMEFQSRIFASVNNNWSRDPMTAKKMDDWMRNVMNLPHHPLMFPAQNSPEARK